MRLSPAAAPACAAPAIAERAMNGAWRFDPSIAKLDDRPERLDIKDGVFSCPTCDPGTRIAADGAFHRARGAPYSDEIMVAPFRAGPRLPPVPEGRQAGGEEQGGRRRPAEPR